MFAERHASGLLIFVAILSLISKKTDAKTTTNFIKQFGYPVEKHNITTSNGYILTLHRIPPTISNEDINDESEKESKVILLMHGLFSSSADFVLAGPNRSLAFYLSDNDYDVWLPDARGNKYSRAHQTLNPDVDPEYWDFSWHELGTEDLPLIIDYILNVTDQEQLDYVGHSQGTTAFFVMASTRPEYNNKIRSLHAMAPVVFMSHIKTPVLKWGNALLDTVQATENNTMELLSYKGRISISLRSFCSMSDFQKKLCLRITFDMVGKNYQQFDFSLLPIVMFNTPAGSSTKQFLHYWQIYNNGKFNMYDYGTEKNSIKYGSEVPPNYDLKNINLKTHIYFGLNDLMTSYEDTLELASKLGRYPIIHNISDPNFNHIDFVTAKDLKTLLNEKILSNLKNDV